MENLTEEVRSGGGDYCEITAALHPVGDGAVARTVRKRKVLAALFEWRRNKGTIEITNKPIILERKSSLFFS